MDTHFRLSVFRILFLFFAFIAGFSAKAQNSLVVQVLPPYSNRLADYANTPNKMLVIVSINGAATPNYSGKVFFRGKLRNVSGDIEIATRPGFRPSMPVNVPVGPGGMPIPYTLNFSEIQNLFDWNNLNFKGISVDRIVQYGMPEDLYQFCIQTVDYVTGNVLIDETCSPPFNVAMLEPPVVIQPMNETTIANMEPQNVLFNWTLSPGAPITTRYTLRIVEMTPNVNPNDALRARNYPMRFFETTVTGNSFLYTAAAPRLEPGKKYAFAVTAADPVNNATFRNNGMSEVHTFQINQPVADGGQTDQLAFTTPHSTDYIAEINSKSSYTVSWLWKSLIDNGSGNVTDEMVKEFCKKHNVDKYRLTFEKSEGRGKIFSKEIPLDYDSHSFPAHHFTITDKNAEEAGFVSGVYYKAVIQAITAGNKTAASAESVPFKYVRIPDDNFKLANIHAVVDYKFEGRPGAYHAVNTPITIEAFRETAASSATRVRTQETTQSRTLARTSIESSSRTETEVEIPFATITAETNAEGVLNVDFPLPDTNDGDFIVFRMKADSRYYLDNNFTETKAQMTGDITRVNFGQQIAQTYGYSLKLYVKKIFTHSETVGSNTYTNELYDLPEGVTVALYRKNKKDYIPPVEGNINDYAHLTGFTEIARAKTQTETVNGRKTAFVQFHNLLATPRYMGSVTSPGINYDEYYIKALKTDESLETSGTSGSTSGAGKTTTTGVTYDVVNMLPAFSDNGFIAEEMMYKLPFPAAYHKDSLYRKVSATYEIASTAPPTSLVKGKLSYKWHSDPNAVVRPMANIKFKVVVDYLIDGKMTYSITGQNKYSFKYPDGSGINLYDLGSVAGSGKTDAQGNFTINIANFNMKGDLMNGVISNSYLSTSSTPDWQQEIGNFDPNIFLNNGGNVVSDNQGGFTVQSPNNATLSPPNNQKANLSPNNLQRVFRIIPESPHYYPSMDHFTVQPLETAEIPSQCSYVKEVSITVTPTSGGKTINEIKMLIFRDPSTRTNDMPIGEGDGNRLVQELLNPQYKTYAVDTYRSGIPSSEQLSFSQLGLGTGVFTEKFEYVCLPKDGGKVTFTGLLPEFTDYYIEACSSPEEGSTNHYRASFLALNEMIIQRSGIEFQGNVALFEDQERWLGIKGPPLLYNTTIGLTPLESRIMVRTIDNSSQQALPGAKISLQYSNGNTITGAFNLPITKYTDNDGYVQIRASETPLKNLFDASNKINDVSFKVAANFAGYKTTIEPGTVAQKGSQFVKTMLMKPAGTLNIFAYSHDEGSIPVKCYIGIDSATMVSTGDDGRLSIPIPAKVGTKIYVVPGDLAYFNDTITITSLPANNKYNFDVALARKKHRIQFNVTDKDTRESVSGFSATLGDDVKKQSGRIPVTFQFENVSVNNYTFIIRGPENSDYIPVAVNIKNEETKIPVIYNVQLEKGSTISGVVTLDGQPVKNAKVYLDISKETTNLTTPVVSKAASLTGTTGLTQKTTTPVPQNVLNTESTQYEQADKDMALLSVHTDAQGKYTLRGVPVNNCKIEVLATLDTSFTVIGDSKQASISNKTAQNVNFTLKKYSNMHINNLYGFPMTIESLKEEGRNVRVTGLVHWSAGVSDFRATDSYKQLRVENVAFKAETVDGRQVGVAVNASVQMQGVTSLKLGYLDGKYNVRLKSAGNSGGRGNLESSREPATELAIERASDGKGSISGKMQIIDNSFNYTASYLNFTNGDDFYLAAKQDGKLSNVIQTIISPLTEKETASITTSLFSGGTSTTSSGLSFVVSGAGSTFSNAFTKLASSKLAASPPARYYLTNSTGGPIKFKLLEFNATANPDSSYIANDGKIHLNVNLSCEIPNAQPSKFNVNIKDMVLDNNNVYPATGSKLNVALGKWMLEVSNWRFDPKEGGIFSEKALIRTEVMDVPAKRFILRNDMFLMEEFDFDNLKLGGGVASVTVNKLHGNGVLQWDNAVGSDMKGHWRLSVTSKTSGQPAAYTSALAGLTPESGTDNRLKISYVQLLDNNEATVSIASGQTFKVRNNALAKFKPQSLYNGSDYLNLTGSLNIGAPGINDMLLKLKYTKPGSALQMESQSIALDFAPSGKVHFQAKEFANKPNIRITETVVEIDGFLSEKPDKTFNSMPALLTAYPAPPTGKYRYNIDISNRYEPAKGWTTQLVKESNTNLNVVQNTSEGSRLQVDKGGMYVSSGNWTKLVYSGKLYDNKNTEDGINGTYMTFTVYGDVTASSNKLELSGANTLFGNLSVKYELENSRLIGDIDAKNVPLGPILVKHGSVRFVSDKIGFYVAGGLATFVSIPIIQGDYNMGFMVGHYNPGQATMEDIWKNYVQKYKSNVLENKCYLPNVINYKLAGFYFGLDRVLFDTHLGYKVAGVGFDLCGYAGLGVDFFTNFSPFAIGASARAKLTVHAEFDALIAKVEGNVDGKGAFDFVKTSSSYNANVNLGMNVGLKVQGCLPLVGCETLFSGTVGCMAEAGTGGFKFQLKEGGIPFKDCPDYKK